MQFVEFLSAFGLGAVVTAFIQAWLAHRSETSKRNFQEKKECYIGLLEAYRSIAIENTNVTAKNFAYWQIRCELVGSERVRKAIEDLKNTNPNSVTRDQAHENLKIALRSDLKITT